MTTPASIDCVGCGKPIPVPADRAGWDRITATVDGQERVVERHVVLRCGACGRTDAVDYSTADESLSQRGWSPYARMNLVVEPVDPPEVVR